MCCEYFGRFHGRNLRLSQIKPSKGKKNISLGIYISSLKPIILANMVEKHYPIIVYYS